MQLRYGQLIIEKDSAYSFETYEEEMFQIEIDGRISRTGQYVFFLTLKNNKNLIIYDTPAPS